MAARPCRVDKRRPGVPATWDGACLGRSEPDWRSANRLLPGTAGVNCAFRRCASSTTPPCPGAPLAGQFRSLQVSLRQGDASPTRAKDCDPRCLAAKTGKGQLTLSNGAKQPAAWEQPKARCPAAENHPVRAHSKVL